ncbi:MAG: RNA methyltransferase, partial [Chrysiogenales bacterium]
PQSCDPLSRRALKVSMGAAFAIPIVMLDDEESGFALLKRYGFTVYGASICGDSIPLHAVKPAEKRAAVFGNESEGLTDRITSLCDETIHIPMYNDTDSLNVAVAAGIILYCLFSSL